MGGIWAIAIYFCLRQHCLASLSFFYEFERLPCAARLPILAKPSIHHRYLADTPKQSPTIESLGRPLIPCGSLACDSAGTCIRPLSGLIRAPALPPFAVRTANMPSTPTTVPETPRVISPSPSLSDNPEARDGYFAPVTRSASRRQHLTGVSEEDSASGSSRSPSVRAKDSTRPRRSNRRSNPKIPASPPTINGSSSNGFLSPKIPDALRDISRSPSPLGLIPLHSRYRNFIHRHEVPRKLLHVSIGFLTLHLYSRGIQTLQITPVLFSALVPVAVTDIVRHRSEKFNKFYIRCVGALMRETEVSGYNGVIWYLLGAYVVLRFFPKDVGVMGVLLLSWCDTAASTFGRLYGRYTPRLRQGKSLAGTVAAWFVGVITAAAFWGWFVPYIGTFPNDPEGAFMFTGRLNLLPDCVRGLLGWDVSETSSYTVTGPAALGVMSVVSGIVAAGSEFVDMWSWDDNLTIPVLSGLGLWGFLKVFG